MAVKKKEASLSIEDKLRAALVADDKQLYPIPENWVWTTIRSAALTIKQVAARSYLQKQFIQNTGSNGCSS